MNGGRGQVTRFPDPRGAPPDSPLAWGGDLTPATLLSAYRHGIFPWPAPDGTLFWWSPDPRAVFPLDHPPPVDAPASPRPGLHVSRSLRRTLRADRFTATADQAFARVVAGCADRGDGTWITPQMQAAYTRLHLLGHAHSLEVWDTNGDLVGGVYGVTIGAAFMGESMFHRVADASKVALVRLVERLHARGFVLFDAQLPTPHLTRMGAVEMPRAAFLDRLAAAVDRPVTFG